MGDAHVVVLGGGGGVGQVAARTLAATDDAGRVTVADLSADAARATVELIGDDRFESAGVDVSDAAALGRLVEGATVVLNCVGPFYRFGAPTLAAVIDAGVDYVDVCDDLDATVAQLELHDRAEAAGVRAVIGMGNSPGLANIFVKLCDEWFLDELHTADIMHIHGGEPEEGAAVLKHRIHAMTSDVPLFVDGGFVEVRQLEESGRAFVKEVDFHGVGRFPAFPYPHPETITLPRVFPHLQRATNLGVIFPLAYFEMTQALVAAGELDVDGIVAELQRERPRLLAEAGVTGPGGCLKVVVTGTKGNATHTYEASVFSTEEGAGEGTGIPAGLGTLLSLRGQLEGGPGVHPPEAVVPVGPLLDLAADTVATMSVSGGGLPLLLEHVGPDGVREEIPFSFGTGS
ncbi:MAG: saccharopine dehydrogenase family protein [Microthrixaceae bacterium]